MFLLLILANLIFLPIFLIFCYYTLTRRKFCMKKEDNRVNGYDERYFLGLIKISQIKYPNLKDVAYREYLDTFEDEDRGTRTVMMHEISLPYDGGHRQLIAMGDKQKTDNLRNYYQQALFDTFKSGKTHYLNESQFGITKVLIILFALPLTLGMTWGLVLWNLNTFFPERTINSKLDSEIVGNDSPINEQLISKSNTSQDDQAIKDGKYPSDLPVVTNASVICKPKQILRKETGNELLGSSQINADDLQAKSREILSSDWQQFSSLQAANGDIGYSYFKDKQVVRFTFSKDETCKIEW